MKNCPICSNDYDDYENISFIAGHGMCVDCYEDKNTPNTPSSKSIDKYLEEYRIRFSNWLSNSDNSKIENFFKSSLLSHEQEVRKEVLEEVESQLLIRIQPITKYCGPANAFEVDKLIREIINQIK